MKKWTADHMPRLAGELAVVTGANSGLGLDTALGLARAGAAVVMACRDPQRAQGALEQVRAAAPALQIEIMALDLASLASVSAFTQAFTERHAQLDILCNNAGVMALPYRKTADGFEMQIGTNHLGHFALTGLLLPALAAAPAARIVTVSSIAHRATRGLDLADLNWERRPYNTAEAYARSKLANLLFTFELARRLNQAGSRAIAVAAHPGYAATNIGLGGSAQNVGFWRALAMRLGNTLLAQPAAMGALPTLYAASMPDVANGDYFGPDGLLQLRGYPARVQSKAMARDAQVAQQLWSLSERLTGVQYLDGAVGEKS